MDKLCDCNPSRRAISEPAGDCEWDGSCPLDGGRFGRYRLHALPNRAHLLSRHKWLLGNGWVVEGLTGHAANRYLGRSGAFWQDESYDHLVATANRSSGFGITLNGVLSKRGWRE